MRSGLSFLALALALWGCRSETSEDPPPDAGSPDAGARDAGSVDAGLVSAVGQIQIQTVPGFLNDRRVWVYLPPGYDTTTDRYPVLYMFDGQNVFDRGTSFAGEWRVDETLEALIPAQEVQPLIVVAVDNGGQARIHEYTPWRDEGVGDGGGGEAHLAAFVDVLMPYINANYRTLTDAANTGIAGSSLGGLMTLYATYTYPDVFGKNAAFSPSIWWNARAIVDFAEGQTQPNTRLWMDMGTAESEDAIEELRAMRDVLVGQGFRIDTDLQVVEAPGARHNESAWALRFDDAMRFLFPGN